MNTPSTPFEKPRSMKAGSILPVHMTRMILRCGGYCSLETPAKSAAEYAHQLHRKPRILGLKSNPAILNSFEGPKSEINRITNNQETSANRDQRSKLKNTDQKLKDMYRAPIAVNLPCSPAVPCPDIFGFWVVSLIFDLPVINAHWSSYSIRSSGILCQRQYLLRYRHLRVDLTVDLFVGEVLQRDRPGRTHGTAEAIALTEDR